MRPVPPARWSLLAPKISPLAPPFQSRTASHIDGLGGISHANEPDVEIPFAAPTERDGADAAELPGHPGLVPCLVERPVRVGAAHRQYPSVGDRVAGAPGSIPTVHSRGDGCDQRHDDGREPKPEGKPEYEDQHCRDADEPSETHEQREGRAEELDRGIGFLVGIADLGHDGSQSRGSLTPHEPLLRPKVRLNQIFKAVADHCDRSGAYSWLPVQRRSSSARNRAYPSRASRGFTRKCRVAALAPDSSDRPPW